MAVDASFDALVERNPGFSVVLRGDFSLCCCGIGDDSTIRGFVESYLSLVSSKRLVKFEHVPHLENPFWGRYEP